MAGGSITPPNTQTWGVQACASFIHHSKQPQHNALTWVCRTHCLLTPWPPQPPPLMHSPCLWRPAAPTGRGKHSASYLSEEPTWATLWCSKQPTLSYLAACSCAEAGAALGQCRAHPQRSSMQQELQQPARPSGYSLPTRAAPLGFSCPPPCHTWGPLAGVPSDPPAAEPAALLCPGRPGRTAAPATCGRSGGKGRT